VDLLAGCSGQLGENILEDYAVTQLAGVDWAGDWDQVDELVGNSDPQQLSDGRGRMRVGGLARSSGKRLGPKWKPRAGRKHGGPWHNTEAHHWAAFYEARYGPQNVRFNQALVDRHGKKLLDLRPDVQAVDQKTGKVYIVEVVDTVSDHGRKRAFEIALGSNFGGYKTITKPAPK
jgi:hypothetical protein